jgi:hypothetical protein
MNRQRNTRSSGRASGAPRRRPPLAMSPPERADHGRPRGRSADGAVISFLSEVLIGDSIWTLAEVQRLIDVRDLVEVVRRPSDELDGEGRRPR